MRRILPLAPLALVLAIALVWRGCNEPDEPTTLINETGDTFNKLVEERDAALREASTLRERLTDAMRGKSVAHVDTLIQYDTVIAPPDTVLLYVTIDGDGKASVDAGVKADSGYLPESRRLDVADCDDGIAVGPSGVACNRAVLGHLELFATVGASRETLWEPTASAGFAWQPSYRSTLDVSVGVNAERKLFVTIRKGVRLF